MQAYQRVRSSSRAKAKLRVSFLIYPNGKNPALIAEVLVLSRRRTTSAPGRAGSVAREISRCVSPVACVSTSSTACPHR